VDRMTAERPSASLRLSVTFVLASFVASCGPSTRERHGYLRRPSVLPRLRARHGVLHGLRSRGYGPRDLVRRGDRGLRRDVCLRGERLRLRLRLRLRSSAPERRGLHNLIAAHGLVLLDHSKQGSLMKTVKLRVARPTDDMAALRRFYVDGLGLLDKGSFRGHEGYDGELLGTEDVSYELEFTHHRDGSPCLPQRRQPAGVLRGR
jgi:hypothetical protein